MRETWVRIVVAASGLLALLLALLFAWTQNPGPSVPKIETAVHLSPLAQAGRAVYLAERCPLCHAIAGEGNPRYPLDGVGDRLDARAMRDWILATGPAATLLPMRASVMKEEYRSLRPDELDALVAYMQTLRKQGE